MSAPPRERKPTESPESPPRVDSVLLAFRSGALQEIGGQVHDLHAALLQDMDAATRRESWNALVRRAQDQCAPEETSSDGP